VRAALLGLILFASGWLILDFARDRSRDHLLGSDEPEWIAISVLHWRQLLGEPPAGDDLRPSLPGTSPWARGVQATTFGYMNPCLPKLVWGASLRAAGHGEASPYVFQVFHRDAPGRGEAAQRALLPAAPLARRIVVLLAALTGVLVFFVARAVVPGAPGWWAAGSAWLLWSASPLVLATAGVIRTDYFMLAFAVGTLLFVLRARGALVGLRGLPAQLLAGAAVGLLGGLATSSKLNGALVLIAFGLAIPLSWWRAGERRGSLGGLALGLVAAAAVSVGVFVALNPLLWSDPVEGVRMILARWEKLMNYFQDSWAPRTGVEVAHGLSERLGLFVRRTVGRDELLGSTTGLPVLGALPILGGVIALALQAGKAGPFRGADDDARAAATIALVFGVVLVAGTAVWLPLDWPRLFLPAAPAVVLFEACLVGLAARAVLARSGS